jgi:hypothetical protein
MNRNICRRAVITAATGLSVYGQPVPADGTDSQRPLGGIAFHYIARVKVNFLDGTGVVYGYLSTLPGLASSAPLFKGTPSEATAYLTFRANINFVALPGNGPLGSGQYGVTPIVVEPGSWSVYFTPGPAHNWDDPDTFSNGQIVATLNRSLEQFSVYPTFAINAGAATWQSSSPFTLGGQTINLRQFAPHGLVAVTSGSPIPLQGSTLTAPIFAVSGYSLAGAR